MSFFAPAAVALVALSALIVVQYFLKLRRPPRPIPSTFLWQRALGDTRANAPWQRLRRDPLMILQLIALAALVLALMRPYVLRAGASGQNLVVVLDASLASQMTDVGGTRFAAEIARAQSLVDNLAPDHTISLIRMDSHPRVLLAGSGDHGALHAMLATQRPGYDLADVRAALTLATSLAGLGQSTGARAQVEVLRSANTALVALEPGLSVQDTAFGSAGAANLGISAFAAARLPNGSTSAVLRVRNTGASARSSDVDIRVDGKLEDVQTVQVAPGDEAVVSSTGLPGNAQVVQAQIMASDSLAADNTAWATLNSGSKPHVLLVTKEDLFLRTMLGADPDVSLSVTTPVRYTASMATGADLVICDGVVPDALPSANLLLIAPARSVMAIGIGAQHAVGTPTVDDDPAGLLRYVTVGGIHVYNRIPLLTAPGWAHVAMRDKNGPLLLEGTPGGRFGRVAVLGFDLHQSDLPLSLDFPVFIVNVLAWLAPTSSLDQSAIHPGEIEHISLPAGATGAAIGLPGGATAPLDLGSAANAGPARVPFAGTADPGIYTVTARQGASRIKLSFAVNPAVALQAQASGIVVARPAGQSASRNGRVPVELTGGAAALVLIVLAGEWYVAMRRR